MHGLDLDDVKFAGRPRPGHQEKEGKIIRYPTEAPTLQEAVSLCVHGDTIAMSQGVYHENVIINKDIHLIKEGEKGDVVIVSRHDTAILVDRCSIKMVDIVIAVEEGALMHHAVHLDHAEVDMDNCEMYGGLYSFFASDKSSVNARRCLFHSAYAFGATLNDSKGKFTDCYFFRNQEDGFNICGALSHASFYRCRISDNLGFGLHVHTGAEIDVDRCDVLRNGQSGIGITGGDAKVKDELDNPKPSLARVKTCRVLGNEWQAIFVHDGSLTCEDSDLRRNTRHSLTLTCSSVQVNLSMDKNGEFLDVEYYNTLSMTGMVKLVGNKGVSTNGDNEISFASALPQQWNLLEKEQIFDLFKRCPREVQVRLHGHPQGWTEAVPGDPAARIKIVQLWTKWATEETNVLELNEVDMPVEAFLKPLGLEDLVPKLHECSCYKVADMMSMTNRDLVNLGLKNIDDRKMILSRLAANSGRMIDPQYKKPLSFQALVEATKIQAKGENMKVKYTEWKKLRPQIVERFGAASGLELDLECRSLFNVMDTNASAEIDEGELRVALQQVFSVNIATVDVEKLMEEGDRSEKGFIDYESFCQIMQAILRS